mmetsp:Transcript_42315/g.95463  ORF Transcript_42315/g.95463 Transcript_42315/m.95463 type:complete len:235 (-) Transcript_42315:7-711(-)
MLIQPSGSTMPLSLPVKSTVGRPWCTRSSTLGQPLNFLLRYPDTLRQILVVEPDTDPTFQRSSARQPAEMEAISGTLHGHPTQLLHQRPRGEAISCLERGQVCPLAHQQPSPILATDNPPDPPGVWLRVHLRRFSLGFLFALFLLLLLRVLLVRCLGAELRGQVCAIFRRCQQLDDAHAPLAHVGEVVPCANGSAHLQDRTIALEAPLEEAPALRPRQELAEQLLDLQAFGSLR